ncbi:hypothetical protein DFH27DRAFT_607949 [Peziza echinospora]|nr:hypothetical protein DFH27DRAFT_607949 [Peziza echinospora]
MAPPPLYCPKQHRRLVNETVRRLPSHLADSDCKTPHTPSPDDYSPTKVTATTATHNAFTATTTPPQLNRDCAPPSLIRRRSSTPPPLPTETQTYDYPPPDSSQSAIPPHLPPPSPSQRQDCWRASGAAENLRVEWDPLTEDLG